MSWALKGQCGRGHVNEQPNAYIIDRFRERGWGFDKAASEALRASATVWWFTKTIMVFRKET